MPSTRPWTGPVGSMAIMVSMADVRLAVDSVRALMTDEGKSALDMMVLTSKPAQNAHAAVRGGDLTTMVIVPVRINRWMRVWVWHVAYLAGEESTSYEWGMGPSLGWAMRHGHRAASIITAKMRHPSSGHAD